MACNNLKTNDRKNTVSSWCKLLVIFTVVSLGSCGSNKHPSQDGAEISESEFHPPIDGKLSEQQLKDYIQIKKWVNQQLAKQDTTTQQISKNAEAVGGQENTPLYFDRLEKVAAESINMSVEEYNWIKNTVINTQSTILVRQYYQLNKKIMRLLDETLSNYKSHQMTQQKNTEQDTMNVYVDEMKQEISSLDDKVADMGSLSETDQHNIEVVSRYQSQLASLEPVSHPAHTP